MGENDRKYGYYFDNMENQCENRSQGSIDSFVRFMMRVNSIYLRSKSMPEVRLMIFSSRTNRIYAKWSEEWAIRVKTIWITIQLSHGWFWMRDGIFDCWFGWRKVFNLLGYGRNELKIWPEGSIDSSFILWWFEIVILWIFILAKKLNFSRFSESFVFWLCDSFRISNLNSSERLVRWGDSSLWIRESELFYEFQLIRMRTTESACQVDGSSKWIIYFT